MLASLKNLGIVNDVSVNESAIIMLIKVQIPLDGPDQTYQTYRRPRQSPLGPLGSVQILLGRPD